MAKKAIASKQAEYMVGLFLIKSKIQAVFHHCALARVPALAERCPQYP